MSLLEFELPDTGEGVTEGTFLEWLVEEGDEVEEDQTVAEVETDKAVVDVPAPASGTIGELKAEPGDTVDVGEVILVMETGEDGGDAGETGTEAGDTGSQEETEGGPEEAGDEKQEQGQDAYEKEEAEEDTEEIEEPGGEEDETGSEEAESDAGSTSGSRTGGDVLALPKVRKFAEEKGVDLARIDGSGPEGRITESDVEQAAGDGSVAKEEAGVEEASQEAEKDTGGESAGTESAPANVDVEATPAVRQFAREEGVDLENVEGSGKGGKITRQDVIDAKEGTSGKADKEEATEPEGKVETRKQEVERVEMSGIRKSIGEKMKQSRFSAPHVTHVEKADVTKLVELREEKKGEVDVHLTYLPFIMKAVLVGLKEHPDLNAELDEENDEIRRKQYYDFNIAVDTERGLMVPVVEGIDDKTIVELARDIEQKVEKTREGEISREEMQGGTFSITNLGVIGGEEFTPIINPPQVAILGIGKIQQTAEVVDGEVVPRHTVKLSLSYDHRVVDGATGARFMNTVAENLEDPGELLMEI